MEEPEHYWIDLTVLGSAYEVQYNPVSDRKRYRRLTSSRLRSGPYSIFNEMAEEWTYGELPTLRT